MKLAIVGSVSLWGNREACDLICKVIEEQKPTRVVSGGALGVDKMAEWIAGHVYKIGVTIYHPKAEGWTYFRARNDLIAKGCDRLVRIYARDTKTWGSGYTAERAKELGKPVVEFIV